MKVELLETMGTDLSVVDAARVSFNKRSEWDEIEVYDTHDGGGFIDYEFKLSERDTKLVNYLSRNNHFTPFTHCFASFRITAPIFVARQLVKHQVGLAWNEVSRRYVDSEPEFYTPDKWRGKAEDKKQGSSDVEITELYTWGGVTENVSELYDLIKNYYRKMINTGIAPEQVRMLLPQSTYTSWIWSGSMYAFARVCNLRCKPDAQLETKMIADMIDKECAVIWPVSWKALRAGA